MAVLSLHVSIIMVEKKKKKKGDTEMQEVKEGLPIIGSRLYFYYRPLNTMH